MAARQRSFKHAYSRHCECAPATQPAPHLERQLVGQQRGALARLALHLSLQGVQLALRVCQLAGLPLHGLRVRMCGWGGGEGCHGSLRACMRMRTRGRERGAGHGPPHLAPFVRLLARPRQLLLQLLDGGLQGAGGRGGGGGGPPGQRGQCRGVLGGGACGASRWAPPPMGPFPEPEPRSAPWFSAAGRRAAPAPHPSGG